MCSDADNGLVPLTKDITCNKIQPEGCDVLEHNAGRKVCNLPKHNIQGTLEHNTVKIYYNVK